MVVFYISHLFTLISYILSAQCAFVDPLRGQGTGYLRLVSQSIASSYNSSLNANRTAKTEGDSEISAPDTHYRSQTVGNGGYWLGDPTLVHGRVRDKLASLK